MYNNNYNYNPNWYQPPGPQPGKHEATVAMVLGIVSCALIGLILGVLVCLLLVWLGAWSFGLFITLVERCL